jgi:leucyl-tRNA synthetase
LRKKINVPAGLPEETLKKTALEDSRIKELTARKEIRKVIVVPGKLVNIVV